MLSFIFTFSLAYIAAALLTSGIGHLLKLMPFCTLVRAHGILPAHVAPLIAVVVVVFELIAGGVAFMLLFKAETVTVAAFLFTACALVGCAFYVYMNRLLLAAPTVASCGCSPLASPLTAASYAPAAALTVVSVLGFVSNLLGIAPAALVANQPTGEVLALSVLWGITLAGLILLFPSSMPPSQGGEYV